MSNYLLVVGNSAVLTVQDTWVRDRLVGQGHSVTYIDDGASIPGTLETAYNGVILSNTANILQVNTKYDATTRGVFALQGYPHSKYTTQVSPSNSPTGTALYVRASGGDAIIPSGSGTNVTYLSSTAIHTYTDDIDFGVGAVRMLASRNDLQTRVAGARYESGVLLSDNATAAPSRRVRIGFTDVTLLNATGQSWFDNTIAWITTGSAPIANAGTGNRHPERHRLQRSGRYHYRLYLAANERHQRDPLFPECGTTDLYRASLTRRFYLGLRPDCHG
jgi:hypothetical protein